MFISVLKHYQTVTDRKTDGRTETKYLDNGNGATLYTLFSSAVGAPVQVNILTV